MREARGRYLRDLLKVHILEKKKDQLDSTASEMEIRRKDGKNIYINIVCSSNMIQNKEIGKILLLKEITDRKRNEKIKQILYHISQIANSDASLNELYPMIFKKLKEIIDTSNVYIALFDEDKNILRFCYSVDETDKKNENLLSLNNNNSKNIFYYIFKTGKSILLNYNKYKKMISEGHFSSHDVITNQQIWLGVPLKVADKTIGSIVLQSYTNPVLYSQKDVKLMEFVAQQIANAILRKTNEEKLKIIHP